VRLGQLASEVIQRLPAASLDVPRLPTVVTLCATVFRYGLHDTDGGDQGDLQHPAPNLEPGDSATTEDGRRWRVVRYVPAPEEAPMHRLLEVEPSSPTGTES
jgi:hypothetical protein